MYLFIYVFMYLGVFYMHTHTHIQIHTDRQMNRWTDIQANRQPADRPGRDGAGRDGVGWNPMHSVPGRRPGLDPTEHFSRALSAAEVCGAARFR